MKTHLPWRLAMLVLGLIAAAAQAASAPRYSIGQIAPRGMANWVEVTAINNRGDVAGYFDYRPPGSQFTYGHAFLWQASTVRDLGTPPGVLNAYVFGMNERGVLVGGDPNGNAYMWSEGTWTDLGFRGVARDINLKGTIVGNYTNSMGWTQGFLLRRGVFLDLGDFGGHETFAFSVNDRDQVVGKSAQDNVHVNPFIWENGSIRLLPTLGGPQGTLASINSRGVAVGSSLDSDFGWATAIYADGDLSRLFGLPGTHLARAINDRGDVVGDIDDGSFLMSGDVVYRLEDQADVQLKGWTQLRPTALNDRGWIAGTGTRNGKRLGFVMIPKAG